MKIGILTQPLRSNYGGLLQTYALQEILKRMGCEPWIIQREKMGGEVTVLMQKAKEIIWHLIGREYVAYNANLLAYLQQYTDKFVERHIYPKTSKINSTHKLKTVVSELGIKGYIVGSDQVWRPSYSPCITNYFLDFVNSQEDIKRIAYAASFGTDVWEFSKSKGLKCAKLAKMFDAISVREYSGIEMCNRYLGVHAVQVLDPAMLLESTDYVKIVREAGESQSRGNLFYYFLDKTQEKENVVSHFASMLSLIPFSTMPTKISTYENLRKCPEECVYPPVTKWLRSFMDAEMVITDSFHGCVFSIIFNKPFWVIGNHQRGMVRFYSLLELFGLEDRLIDIEQIHDIESSTMINWSCVNARMIDLKIKSLEFIRKAIRIN